MLVWTVIKHVNRHHPYMYTSMLSPKHFPFGKGLIATSGCEESCLVIILNKRCNITRFVQLFQWFVIALQKRTLCIGSYHSDLLVITPRPIGQLLVGTVPIALDLLSNSTRTKTAHANKVNNLIAISFEQYFSQYFYYFLLLRFDVTSTVFLDCDDSSSSHDKNFNYNFPSKIIYVKCICIMNMFNLLTCWLEDSRLKTINRVGEENWVVQNACCVMSLQFWALELNFCFQFLDKGGKSNHM